MKLSEAFSILIPLRLCFMITVKPTIMAILSSPSLLVKPRALSQIIFYNIWMTFGHGANEGSRDIKERLITPNARGAVLDLGAGLGTTIEYLSKGDVTRYVAVEPNVLWHPHIKDAALKAGYSEDDGSLLILSCGAEDYKTIAGALGGLGTVDTIISVLTLCSVPDPEQTIENLVCKLLKPGGEFLFLEHIASKRPDVRFWQWLWSPLWKVFFDGCNLNRPTDVYVLNVPYWRPALAEHNQEGLWSQTEEDKDGLLSHQTGRFIKCSSV